LGYEPQWVMIKRTDTAEDWQIIDNMRGWTADGVCQRLVPNTSAAEAGPTGSTFLFPTATGFGSAGSSAIVNASGGTYIYIAIRRGPMKPPTVGTSVFQPTVWTGTGAALQQNVNINYDAFLQFRRNGGYFTPWMDKLRGFGYSLYTQGTNSEVDQTAFIAGPKINNYINFVDGTYNLSSEPWLNYAFVRAPSFFDEVCYTGTGSNTTFSHNLTVAPELMIVKSRSNPYVSWFVYASALGATKYLILDGTNSASTFSAAWNNTAPTSSVFTVGGAGATNGTGETFVAYLFATCAGVSKCFNYTGNGSSQTINCGFTGGARWILIKRTDSTGDWYCWDSARGIVSGNDPHISLNTTAAEVTSDDTIDTDSTGFVVNQVSATNVNVSSATYIGLAIA